MPEAEATRAERKAAVRGRVLDIAARAIRKRGVDGVSVGSVMQEAGLTHGTFYAHFSSKDDLIAHAVSHAADTYRKGLREKAMREGGGKGSLASAYLTPAHADDPANGCFIAALGPEANRLDGPVHEAFSGSVSAGIAMVEEVLAEAGGDDAHRERAIASLATVVGGMILARAHDDPKEREEVMRICREALTERGAVQ